MYQSIKSNLREDYDRKAKAVNGSLFKKAECDPSFMLLNTIAEAGRKVYPPFVNQLKTQFSSSTSSSVFHNNSDFGKIKHMHNNRTVNVKNSLTNNTSCDDYSSKPFTSIDNNKDFGYLKYLDNA